VQLSSSQFRADRGALDCLSLFLVAPFLSPASFPPLHPTFPSPLPREILPSLRAVKRLGVSRFGCVFPLASHTLRLADLFPDTGYVKGSKSLDRFPIRLVDPDQQKRIGTSSPVRPPHFFMFRSVESEESFEFFRSSSLGVDSKPAPLPLP